MKKAISLLPLILSASALYSAEAIWKYSGENYNWSNMNNWWTTTGMTQHPTSISAAGDVVVTIGQAISPSDNDVVLTEDASLVELRFGNDSTIDLGGFTLTQDAYGRSNRNRFLGQLGRTGNGKTAVISNGKIVSEDSQGTLSKFVTYLGVGAFTLKIGDGTKTTTFETNGSQQVYGGTKESAQAVFVLENGATMSATENIEFGSTNASFNMSANIKGIINSTGSFVAYADAHLDLQSGASITASGVNLQGTSNILGSITTSVGQVKITDDSIISGTINSGNVIRFDNGNMQVTSSASLSGKSMVIYNGATVTLQTQIDNMDGIFLYGNNSTLILDAVDVRFAPGARNIQLRRDITDVLINHHNTVEVRKSNKLVGFAFENSNQTLDIVLDGTPEVDRALLELVNLVSAEGNPLSGDNIINFKNFSNNTVLIQNKFDNSLLEYIRFNGEQVDADDINWLLAENGWYYLNLIPEPAEWAAIFGVLALFVAMRRKRA